MTNKTKTLQHILHNAEALLSRSKKLSLSHSDIRNETRLLAHLLVPALPFIPTTNDLETLVMSSKQHDTFLALIERRSNAEPMAYLTGEKEFWSLPLHVNSDTLIPRPDSETLIESLLAWRTPAAHPNAPPPRVLDLYTGAAPLLLAALTELDQAIGVGIDVSPGAIAMATKNAQRNNLSNRCSFLVEDLHDVDWTASDPYDCIFANPPYVTGTDYQALMFDVKEYEPKQALVGEGVDGLHCYEKLAQTFQENRLQLRNEESLLIMEVGIHQDQKVVDLLETMCGMRMREVRKDYGGVPRSVVMSPGK